ncbi:PhzF family phenazine biosynthesis protein [Gynuella sunshinyii]|uniref:Putative epimerase, PhzC/PhzF-like protein n=1 Tax=Gynuella sunshinyii YC6258 TaxID=1445510 RepID=A0A0C5VNZ0_9GAMM|nr:PhzF family phenazine biosynthesis protein [Gynuella sunshinyii]AJQ96387.1 putative epimerase, PhzC/PhzF-like protein [Gynuella sunshinyii YC6258]
MKLPIFQVDAFTDQVFKGNPAAVIPLYSWLSDTQMQMIAAENNLSETAFFVPSNDGFHLRWFTPGYEIELCGHATLATAHVLWHELNYQNTELRFQTMSGELLVTKTGSQYQLDFPEKTLRPFELASPLRELIRANPVEVWENQKIMVVLENEQQVADFHGSFSGLDIQSGVILTAPGDQSGVDFVSRFFVNPASGINEDPVTGSAHCLLTPYWSQRLNKTRLTARQISKRSGDLLCQLRQGRVLMTGSAVTYLSGNIYLEQD